MKAFLNPAAKDLYHEKKTLIYKSKDAVGLDLAACLFGVTDENITHFLKWNDTDVTDPTYSKMTKPYLELEFLDQVLIPTGVFYEAAPLQFGLLTLRSGFSIKSGCQLTNGVGIIDPDYRGELVVSVRCFSKSKIRIYHGDRIAQLIFVPYLRYNKIEVVDSLDEILNTERGQKGLGSTGE